MAHTHIPTFKEASWLDLFKKCQTVFTDIHLSSFCETCKAHNCKGCELHDTALEVKQLLDLYKHIDIVSKNMKMNKWNDERTD